MSLQQQPDDWIGKALHVTDQLKGVFGCCPKKPLLFLCMDLYDYNANPFLSQNKNKNFT